MGKSVGGLEPPKKESMVRRAYIVFKHIILCLFNSLCQGLSYFSAGVVISQANGFSRFPYQRNVLLRSESCYTKASNCTSLYVCNCEKIKIYLTSAKGQERTAYIISGEDVCAKQTKIN